MKKNYELGMIGRFDFFSKLLRMKNLVKDTNDNFYKSFCKGSPKKVIELSKPETIPDILNTYTRKGFHVLALSCRLLKINFNQAQQNFSI